MLFSNLLVRQQTLQLCYVGRICEAFLAEVALQLSGLAMAVEQVALANVTALELTVLGNGKSLFCTAVRFDLRHKVLLLFELGLLFYRAALRAQLREAMEQILTKRRVRDLAATEANRNLDLVAVLQEAASVLYLGVQVADVDIRRQANLFDLHDTLILSRFLLALCLLEAEFTVIHDLADRRLSLRRDFDQIHALFYGDILCLLNRQNAELFAVVTDQTNFLVADLFIDLMFHAADW